VGGTAQIKASSHYRSGKYTTIRDIKIHFNQWLILFWISFAVTATQLDERVALTVAGRLNSGN
jgi:hypothetical protein